MFGFRSSTIWYAPLFDKSYKEGFSTTFYFPTNIISLDIKFTSEQKINKLVQEFEDT